MAIQNISQLRRVIFRKYSGSAWSVWTLEPDDLGKESVASFNIAPRLRSRESQLGTTNSPIKGTFDNLSASITFMADTFKNIGLALDNWTASTYADAPTNAGQVSGGDGTDYCDEGYYSVVLQGVCDDGSTADIEFTRCQPSIDDDIEIGTSSSTSITLNLHPIIYNASLHASDGYPAKTYRLGDENTTKKTRLNATTGVYDDVES